MTSSPVILSLIDQPTTIRQNRSIKIAKYSHPFIVLLPAAVCTPKPPLIARKAHLKDAAHSRDRELLLVLADEAALHKR
jgi:hypothetical protein